MFLKPLMRQAVGSLVGVAGGHLTARLPLDRKSSFGVVFDTKPEQPQDQVLYGSAKATTVN